MDKDTLIRLGTVLADNLKTIKLATPVIIRYIQDELTKKAGN